MQGMKDMPHRQPKLSLIDIPALLFSLTIAALFALMLVAPFTQGL